MKTLIRLGAVLVAVALCAPALACSEMMQQTTAQTTEQQPAVAKAQTKQTKQTATKAVKAQPKVAKAQAAKVAAN